MVDQGIQVDRSLNSATILMPTRDLEKGRKLGWFFVGFAAIGIAFMCFWISSPLLSGVDMVQKGEPFGFGLIFFALLGLPGIVISVMILSIGLSIIKNQTRGVIKICDHQLVYQERFGWCFKTVKRIDLANIERLEIVPIKELFSQNTESVNVKLDSWLPADLYCVRIHDLGGASERSGEVPGIALAYPRDQLLALVPILTEEINQASKRWGLSLSLPGQWGMHLSDSQSSNKESQVEITVNADDRPRPTQPSDSKFEILRVPGQPIVYRMTAPGLTGYIKNLFLFGFLWTCFTILMGVVFLFSWTGNRVETKELVIFPIIFIPFLAVGGSLLVYSLSLARRTSMIGIDEHQFFCETKGLRKVVWSEIDREEIESIQVEDSTMSVDDRPLRQLRIRSRNKDQKDIKLFIGLSDSELDWICYELQAELGLMRENATTE